MCLLRSRSFWHGIAEGFGMPFTLFCRARHLLGIRAPYWRDNPRWAMAYRKRLTPHQRTELRRDRRKRASHNNPVKA